MKGYIRPFQIDNVWCSWQLMWDCAHKEYVCYRCVRDALNDKSSKRHEKVIKVPRPDMTEDEKRAADALFELMCTEEKTRDKILDLLVDDRWHRAAEMRVEELAKADWERYGEGASR